MRGFLLLAIVLGGLSTACADGGSNGGPATDASVVADTRVDGSAVVDVAPETAPVACGTPGAPCCIGVACLEGLSCVADKCVASCGVSGQACCAGNKCDATTVCLGGTCQPATDCGGEGKPCCASSTCAGSLVCAAGKCESSASCGTAGSPCCAGGACSAGLQCTSGTCVACGAASQPCCAGGSCAAATTCDASMRCVSCGAASQPCCAGTSCVSGTSCVGGTCSACGVPGSACCGGTTCSSGYCFTGNCHADPSLTTTFSEGAECADLGIAHASGLARHVIKARPGAAVIQFYRHTSCGDAFTSRPWGTVDATGTFVDDVGNPAITDCKHAQAGRWEVYFTIDGVATKHTVGTFYNSTCPAPLATCSGAATFCPPP